VVQSLLALVGQPSANDSDEIFFSFRVDDSYEPAIDGSDGDETVFEFRRLRVEDLELVGARLEEPLSFRECQTVLALVADVFRVVPLDAHVDRQ
jgi:hypothetical protein